MDNQLRNSEEAEGLLGLWKLPRIHGFEEVSKAPTTPPPPQSFSTDYPQKGFVHKVEKGETVSSIAKKYESKVSWIINANQIADPTKVFVGKELFVPQK